MTRGYQFRALTLQDAAELVRLRSEYARECGMVEEDTEESLRHTMQWPGTQLGSDSMAAVVDDQIAGFNVFRHIHSDQARLWGAVRAPFRGRGIGTALMTWGIGRARSEPQWATVFAGGSSLRTEAHALYQRLGFRHARTFNAMVHSDPHSVRAPSWPDGVTWRNDLGDSTLAVATDVHNRGFVGHWDFSPLSEVAMSHVLNEPGAGRGLSFFAYLGDLPVAFCLCRLDGERAFVNMLATDPVARGRGIGLALLNQAMIEMASRGAARVELTVDADNPTAAVRLYERAGMMTTGAFKIFELKLAG